MLCIQIAFNYGTKISYKCLLFLWSHSMLKIEVQDCRNSFLCIFPYKFLCFSRLCLCSYYDLLSPYFRPQFSPLLSLLFSSLFSSSLPFSLSQLLQINWTQGESHGTFFKKLFIDFRETGEGRKRGKHWFCCSTYLHSLVASHMCPDQRSNLQSWHMGRTL